MDRFGISVILMLICMSLISACSDSSPIIIGFSGQLTGKAGDMGVSARNGAQLAVEIINAKGGIHGRSLKLISKDDGNTPQMAIQADKALVAEGAVAIVGHMTSSQTIAAMPFISENEVILISPTSSTPLLSAKKDHFFRVIVDSTFQSRELADYARSALDLTSVVLVTETDNNSYSYPFSENFTQAFERHGGKVLKQLNYSSTKGGNWDQTIDALVDLKPDALLLVCPAHDAVSLIQRIRSANLKIQILSGGWAYTEQILNWGGQDVEGVYFVIGYTADNPNPNFIKFRESYKNRFGNNPSYASAFAYEAILALAEGLRKTHGESTGLAEAMAPSKEIAGVISDLKLNEYGDVERNIFVVTVLEGEFRTVEMR